MMTLQQLARVLGAEPPAGERAFAGVSTDSRAIAPGQLFIALKGEHFDGHDYVSDVLARGAAGALVDAGFAAAHPEWPLVGVADTRQALGRFAAHWRSLFNLPVIGVVGSNGKTTVKEMCAAILREQHGEARVLATRGNLNNDIGLPLTVLGLRPEHKAAVIEIGMNHPGETAELAAIAAPGVALINNAQREHQEFMKNVAAVAAEHAAAITALSVRGVAVINGDDAYADLWRAAAGKRRLLSFGIDRPADVTGHFSSRGFGGLLQLGTPWGGIAFQLGVPGRHNARNACAAAAATLATGVGLDAVARALSRFSGVKGRLQRRQGLQGALVIDDSYNANPDSMQAAVNVLAAIPGKRIFVMGDMGEVGDAAGQFHDEIGGYAKSAGIDRLFAIGEHAAAAVGNFGPGAQHFARIEDLIKAVLAELDRNATVLVKGSRFMRMERVADAITEPTSTERAQPANIRHPLPGEGGRGEGGVTAGQPPGDAGQSTERAQPANIRHPLPGEGGRGEGENNAA